VNANYYIAIVALTLAAIGAGGCGWALSEILQGRYVSTLRWVMVVTLSVGGLGIYFVNIRWAIYRSDQVYQFEVR